MANAIPPALASNYGEQFVASLREYMAANSIKSLGGIGGKLLAELAQVFHDKFTASQKTVKRHKIQLANDEAWIAELEAEPAVKGIDVRKELGKCQFWCKTRGRICTRRTFEKWLLNPNCERVVNGSYDGASSKPRVPPTKPFYSVQSPVPGWPRLLRFEVFPNTPDEELDRLCAGDWSDLPLEIREKIAANA